MKPRVIVLNGGSSSGKTSIARCLQSLLLPEAWLTIGVDTLIDAAPAELWGSTAGIVVAADGRITIGPELRRLEAAWTRGVAAMAHAGAGLILDQVFLEGPVAQQRWSKLLEGLPILCVGVRCDARVAAEREAARGDRAPGMAAAQADLVHRGMRYDVEVDTAHTAPQECARVILRALSDTES
jgi:chloramphenicol 3-O phosphotransferase